MFTNNGRLHSPAFSSANKFLPFKRFPLKIKFSSSLLINVRNVQKRLKLKKFENKVLCCFEVHSYLSYEEISAYFSSLVVTAFIRISEAYSPTFITGKLTRPINLIGVKSFVENWFLSDRD